MAIIRITIKDIAGHWHKRIWIFGISLYHRHDYTQNYTKRTVGFDSMPYNPVDVSDEDSDDE